MRVHIVDSMTATTGLGASRGRLRIRDADSGVLADFYCGGPPTSCNTFSPTGFFGPGMRLIATCSVTKENILVMPTVNCSAGFSP
jgi:hypothetical protein